MENQISRDGSVSWVFRALGTIIPATGGMAMGFALRAQTFGMFFFMCILWVPIYFISYVCIEAYAVTNPEVRNLLFKEFKETEERRQRLLEKPTERYH